ncbi:MAG: hypothetical protein AABY22_23955 [Nanoarchaeota archaeon]
MIKTFLKKIFGFKEKEEEYETVSFPDCPTQKRWSEMNWAERTKYVRWLQVNGYWDGDIVIENIERWNRK